MAAGAAAGAALAASVAAEAAGACAWAAGPTSVADAMMTAASSDLRDEPDWMGTAVSFVEGARTFCVRFDHGARIDFFRNVEYRWTSVTDLCSFATST
jgi:hypothetical protein